MKTLASCTAQQGFYCANCSTTRYSQTWHTLSSMRWGIYFQNLLPNFMLGSHMSSNTRAGIVNASEKCKFDWNGSLLSLIFQVHERNVQSDFLLILLKNILLQRRNFKVSYLQNQRLCWRTTKSKCPHKCVQEMQTLCRWYWWVPLLIVISFQRTSSIALWYLYRGELSLLRWVRQLFSSWLQLLTWHRTRQQPSAPMFNTRNLSSFKDCFLQVSYLEDVIETIQYNLEEDSPCALKKHQLIKVSRSVETSRVSSGSPSRSKSQMYLIYQTYWSSSFFRSSARFVLQDFCKWTRKKSEIVLLFPTGRTDASQRDRKTRWHAQNWRDLEQRRPVQAGPGKTGQSLPIQDWPESSWFVLFCDRVTFCPADGPGRCQLQFTHEERGDADAPWTHQHGTDCGKRPLHLKLSSRLCDILWVIIGAVILQRWALCIVDKKVTSWGHICNPSSAPFASLQNLDQGSLVFLLKRLVPHRDFIASRSCSSI